jgi:NitT/TauT family transport system permease protein
MTSFRVVLGFALLLGLWIVLLATGALDAQFVPWPSTIGRKLLTLCSDWAFQRDFLSTVWRMLMGFVLAGLVGIGAGLVVGHFRRLWSLFFGPLDFLRSFPATAVIPLFLLLLGVGNASKIGVVVFSCALINMIHAIYGVQAASEAHLMMAKVFRARRSVVIAKIVLPGAMPHILAGLRITLSLALVLIVVVEMLIGTGHGLGQRLVEAQMTYRIPEMYAIILVLGATGFVFNRGVVWVQRRLVHWVPIG